MSSQEECHANQLLALGNNKGQEMIAGSGQKLLPLYDSFSRYGSSLRMFTALCLSNTGWHSSRCALHWKASVTKSNRLLFQLVPSMRRTSGRECGLLPIMWPTPKTPTGGGQAFRRTKGGGLRKLEDAVVLVDGIGPLNPEFCEWLMGYPIGWTELGD